MDQAVRDEAARRAESTRKRTHSDSFDLQSGSKKTKMELEDPSSSTAGGMSALASFDFSTLPHALISDLVIANLLAVSQERLAAVVQVSSTGQYLDVETNDILSFAGL